MLCVKQIFIPDSRARNCGFTLVELIVVISIISLLMGVFYPVLVKVHEQATTLVSMQNQGQIVDALSLFAADNDEKYPESVATIGMESNWHWQDPRMITGYLKRSPKTHRAISEYLVGYLDEADSIICPHSPSKYKFLEQAWQMGDDWDSPETPPKVDSLVGSYCFYWNYVGYSGANKSPFKGPRTPAASNKTESKLLVSCYFGFNHWRSPDAFGSCEKMQKSAVVPETFVASDYWATDVKAGEAGLKIKLNAGYTDGHVESYRPTDTVPIKVAITRDGYTPYPDSVGPGIFYLPSNAIK